jgi:hypothetical protein
MENLTPEKEASNIVIGIRQNAAAAMWLKMTPSLAPLQ